MPDAEGHVVLTGKDYHYLARVRRLCEGETFSATLPSGHRVQAKALAVTREHILLDIVNTADGLPDKSEKSLPHIVLIQALPQGSKMDLIVRQAAECGVAEIVPFVAARSVRRCGETQTERWRRIIRAGREQSGSTVDTHVREPVEHEELFEIWKEFHAADVSCIGILLHTTPLAQCTLHDYLTENITLIALVVGPEGGFSPEEAKSFISHGFKPLSLGRTVLRTETAALFAIAAVQIMLMEKGSWKHTAKE